MRVFYPNQLQKSSVFVGFAVNLKVDSERQAIQFIGVSRVQEIVDGLNEVQGMSLSVG